jgi:LysR family transcriptional regulator, glycine cleavage system transcriptional activator
MVRRTPPLNWLRSFESAARHLSFTAAGDELALTQAAVSQHVKSLEQYLGNPLFARMPRSLRLTDHGRAYHRRIEPILEQISQDTEEIFGQHTSNQITLRVNVAFSVLWLAPRLDDFLKKNPNILLRISNPVWSLSEMEDGADLEIRYGTGDWPDLRVDQLTEEKIFPVCAPSSAKAITKALDKATLIHVIGYRDGWTEWCKIAGRPDVDSRKGMQCDNSLMASHTAINGDGVAIARSTLVKDMLDRGELVRPFEESFIAKESFYLVSQLNTPETRACETFREWLLEQARSN